MRLIRHPPPAAFSVSFLAPPGGKCEHSHLLVTSCGRSGTHAIASALTQAGIDAIHEKKGTVRNSTVIVAWMGTGPAFSSQYWGRHRCYAPIIKLHREPLGAITSLVDGFSGGGGCTNKAATNDARSWRLASQWLELPFRNETNGWHNTCQLPRQKRLALALHYWVGWNQLGDAVAAYIAQVETATPSSILEHWCGYCKVSSTCTCSASVKSTRSNSSSSPREGHGRPSLLMWQELHELDAELTIEAARLARYYGYAGSDPSGRESDEWSSGQ